MKHHDKSVAQARRSSPSMRAVERPERPLWLVRWPFCEMTVEIRLMPCDTTCMDADGWHEFDSATWLHRVWIRLVRRERTEAENFAATIGIAAHEFEHVATASVRTMRVRPTALGTYNELRAYIIQSLTKLFTRKLSGWWGVQVGPRQQRSDQINM